MRKLVFSAAMSVDGFIAGPKGEYDWITPDPGFDFLAMFRRFDTILIGRRTYETMLERGQTPKSMGMKAIVVSTTLDAQQNRDVTILRERVSDSVADIKAQEGKGIWLCGGAALFRTLLDAGLVDSVELAVLPILLGGGLRVVPDGRRWPLQLEKSESFPNGMLVLTYFIPSPASV